MLPLLKLCLRDDTAAREGVGGEVGRDGSNEAPPCLQNILKRVEERSDREGTALDAHKELEMVSPRDHFPSKSLSLVASPVTVSSWHSVYSEIDFCNPEESLGLEKNHTQCGFISAFSTPPYPFIALSVHVPRVAMEALAWHSLPT